ncbi:hypothetical protein ACH4E7_09670 [Kitasatospora sp. NPDC018058]|uniref:hypothetical protein n=1 Tax=Kitasatospora sp. NPDC018058 TaxID=3364025 RepID=UPI0037C06F3A
MSRRLRYIGNTSGDDGCPTLYEDVDTGEVVVQGDVVTDPDEMAQFRNIKPGEGFVTVPRALLADFAPRDVDREPVLISYESTVAAAATRVGTPRTAAARRRVADA